MNAQQQQLNDFLVSLFNDILRLEERSLAHGAYKNLSVSEMHLLDAASRAPAEPPLTMAALAARVGVSAGSLTVAVKALEQKGYLLRQRSDADRRRVLVALTEKGRGACQAHNAFHESMVQRIGDGLPPEQLAALLQALHALDAYFSSLSSFES